MSDFNESPRKNYPITNDYKEELVQDRIDDQNPLIFDKEKIREKYALPQAKSDPDLPQLTNVSETINLGHSKVQLSSPGPNQVENLNLATIPDTYNSPTKKSDKNNSEVYNIEQENIRLLHLLK